MKMKIVKQLDRFYEGSRKARMVMRGGPASCFGARIEWLWAMAPLDLLVLRFRYFVVE